MQKKTQTQQPHRVQNRHDDSIACHKTRLVAKSFTQQPGLDLHETFSPVVKPTTIRTALSIAISKDGPIPQLDVQNTFLHGELPGDIYISKPQVGLWTQLFLVMSASCTRYHMASNKHPEYSSSASMITLSLWALPAQCVIRHYLSSVDMELL